jgi:hypothetical protein
MAERSRKISVLAALLCAALVGSSLAEPLEAQGRGRSGRGATRHGLIEGQLPRAFQEPAFARGYGEGFRHGQKDGRSARRYDPVASRAYRDGDQGYERAYGSREAYKNNYRAGFRQGYEDGYRDRSK